MNEIYTAYHFTNNTLRDGRGIPKVGTWLKHVGKVSPCVSGLHASLHPFDALKYAPGNVLHLVEVKGGVILHKNNGKVDKLVGRQRKVVSSINTEKLLRDFARWNALQVIHLWPNPPKVVVKFLNTGDESLRDAAWAAAMDAAWAAARAAAATRDAAKDAATAAVRDAAATRDAAWTAARAAVRAAATAAATAAAATRDAAAAATRAAAAAMDAARDAVRDAFTSKSRAQFKRMVKAEFKKQNPKIKLP